MEEWGGEIQREREDREREEEMEREVDPLVVCCISLEVTCLLTVRLGWRTQKLGQTGHKS